MSNAEIRPRILDTSPVLFRTKLAAVLISTNVDVCTCLQGCHLLFNHKRQFLRIGPLLGQFLKQNVYFLWDILIVKFQQFDRLFQRLEHFIRSRLPFFHLQEITHHANESDVVTWLYWLEQTLVCSSMNKIYIEESIEKQLLPFSLYWLSG